MESMKFFEYMQYLTESKESEFVISDDDKKVFKDAGFGFNSTDKNFVYPIGKIKLTGDFKVVGEADDKMYTLALLLKSDLIDKDIYLSKIELKKISVEVLINYVETCLDIYSSIKTLDSMED